MPHDKLLVYGVYERAFLAKAIQDGFATFLNLGNLDDTDYTDAARRSYGDLYARTPFRSAVLQMFLIYEKLVLVGGDPTYDTDKLIRTGFVDILSFDDEPGLLGGQEWNLAERGYAMHLKPFLMDRLTGFLSHDERAELKRYGLTARQFFSTFYDLCFLDRDHLDSCRPPFDRHTLKNVLSFLDNHTNDTYERQKQGWKDHLVNPNLALSTIRARWKYHVTESAGSLMALLEHSVLREAALLQNEFRLKDIDSVGVANNLNAARNTVNAYTILRTCYEGAIGELPKLASLSEAVRLKEQRSKDIARLRSVVAEIEESLRSGAPAAARTATRSLHKAARDLARGTTTDKVNRWITYLSLPVTIVEQYLALPPVAGTLLGTTGFAATLAASVMSAKGRWTLVVR